MLIEAARVLVFLLLLLLPISTPLSSFAAEEEPHDALYEASSVMAKGDVIAAMKMLDKLADEYPNSIQVRKFRGDTYWFIGRGEVALEDYEHVLALTPDDTNVMLHRCMLFESMGRDANFLKSCYSKVVEKMRQKYSAVMLVDDQDYVFAVMLAELPEAEAVKQSYIEQIPIKFNWDHTTLDKKAQEQLIKQEQDGIRHFDRSTLKKSYDRQREALKKIAGEQFKF